MSNNKVIKSSIWYTASNFLLKGLAFITIPLYARLLTKAEFGLFNNFTSWLSIFIIIGTVSLGSSLISARFDYAEDLDSYILSILTLGSLITATIYIIVRVNISFFENFLSVDRIYIDFMFFYIILSQAIGAFQSTQRFQYRYKKSTVLTVVTSLASVLASLALVLTFDDKLSGRIIGHYTPLIAVNAFLYINYIKKGVRIRFAYWSYALRICIPFIPHLLSLTVLSASDKTMITALQGPSETALYSIAYSIASIITILWSSINTAFSPWLSEKIQKKETSEVYNMSTLYVLIVAVIVVGIMLIAPEVLLFMGGEQYIEAMYVIPPVMLGCLFQYVYTMYVNIEQFLKKTVGMAFASASAAIINISLNLLFISRFGYIAAAYTTMVSYAFLFVFHYVLVRRMGMSIVYNTKNIILILLSGVLITFSINLLYEYNLARYVITGIYVLILLLFLFQSRKKVLSLFGK